MRISDWSSDVFSSDRRQTRCRPDPGWHTMTPPALPQHRKVKQSKAAPASCKNARRKNARRKNAHSQTAPPPEPTGNAVARALGDADFMGNLRTQETHQRTRQRYHIRQIAQASCRDRVGQTVKQ